jgi:NADH-quinone oxidoreductase subunit E
MDNNAIDKIVTKHKSERGALISILHDVQREEGYVPDDVMGYLSKTLQIPISEIFRVVSYFNKAFSLKPREKHKIKVCQGTACHLKHADQLLAEITEECGEDGKIPDFHVEQVRCLGCCTVAPAVEVNGEIVDKDTAKNTITKLKGEK